MQLGDFLNKLAAQSGVTATDTDLVSILSHAELATANIPDTFANKIQSGLLTTDAAKNDPELKRYFTALALNALDSELTSLTDELGVPDEVKEQLKQEKSSYKRAAMLARKIKELEAAKVAATGEDKDNLAKQIKELNEQLHSHKTLSEKEKSELIEAHRRDRVGWEMNTYYEGYNYALPLSKEANKKLADQLVNEEMMKNNIRIENIDGKLTLRTKEGTDYYVNNQPVTVKDFIDKTLATHKVLVIDDDKSKQQPQQQQFSQQQQQRNDKPTKAAAFVEAELAATLDAIKNK